MWKIIQVVIQAFVALVVISKIPYGSEFVGYSLVLIYSTMMIYFRGLANGIIINASLLENVLVHTSKAEQEKRVHKSESEGLEKLTGKFTTHETFLWWIIWLIALIGILGT